MALEGLVASAVSVLAPYVAAGAKKAAEVAGVSIAGYTGKLLLRIKEWFSGDPEATAALENFEAKPDRYASLLQDILLEKANGDPLIAEELAALLEAMGPRVEVFQKIKTLAGEATGLDISKWEKGAASAYQDVEIVEDSGTLIGAKIGYPPS